jgi:hypothetical protein
VRTQFPPPGPEEGDQTHPQWLYHPLPEEYEAVLQDVPRGFWSAVYPVEFSILDAATMEYLTPPPFPVIERAEVKREQLSTGSVQYTLHHFSLGSLGSVYLRKLDEKLTEFGIKPPPMPEVRTRSREEDAALDAEHDPVARDHLHTTFAKKWGDEQEAHYRWRRALQLVLINKFLGRLEEERNWVAAFPNPNATALPSEAQRFSWRYAEDRWLWEQVNVHGKLLRHVFQEWKDRAAHRDLNDPYDTAKKVIQKGRKDKGDKN